MLHHRASIHRLQSPRGLQSMALVAIVALAAAGTTRCAVAGETTAQPTRVIDVKLGAENTLRGQISDVSGQAIENAPLALLQNGKLAATATADAQGHFQFSEIGTGVYVVATPGTATVCRAWTANSAPPIASPQVLIVADGKIVRAQSFRSTSFYEWIEMHPIVGYTGLTAVIAVPIILATGNDDDDAS
jgi:hypothetical protein